jgi:hypothetical protein
MSSPHFSQTARQPKIQGLVGSLRARRPSGQPIWRSALRLKAMCEKCRLDRFQGRALLHPHGTPQGRVCVYSTHDLQLPIKRNIRFTAIVFLGVNGVQWTKANCSLHRRAIENFFTINRPRTDNPHCL